MVDLDAVRRHTEASRRAQGLTPSVADPAVLRRVAQRLTERIVADVARERLP